jgi:hypothetical protein
MTSSFVDRWQSLPVLQSIERLLADFDSLGPSNDSSMLNVRVSAAHHVLRLAQAEIERLTEERDEMRRLWCAQVATQSLRPQVEACLSMALPIAHTNGWTCFDKMIAARPDKHLFYKSSYGPDNDRS